MLIETGLQQQFEQCIEQCADSLFRVAFRLTSNRTLASELVQETYLNAWKNIHSLKDKTKLRSWVFSILRNQYTKILRAEKKAATTHDSLEQFVANENTSSQRDEAVDRVQSAIGQLDDNHKLPILLVSMEGLSVDEAATILDLPRGTVLSRLHRGRQKLKAILSRETRKEESDGV